jgi:hypothetical protein
MVSRRERMVMLASLSQKALRRRNHCASVTVRSFAPISYRFLTGSVRLVE